jgi:molybdenum cofactor cytidylyltransferase
VEALQAAGVDGVIVVVGHEAAAVESALGSGGAATLFNPEYAAGRATSVRAGARAAPDGHAVLILNVDQPRPPALIAGLIRAHRSGKALITVPAYRGRRGHPTIFAAALQPELRTVRDEQEGLRAVMRAHATQVAEWSTDDDRVLLDMNTPEAYQQALRAFGLAAHE